LLAGALLNFLSTPGHLSLADIADKSVRRLSVPVLQEKMLKQQSR
jgi:hypothetical protein